MSFSKEQRIKRMNRFALMWYRCKDTGKGCGFHASNLMPQQVSDLNLSRVKAGEKLKPLATQFGYTSKDYDLSDTVKKITNYVPCNVHGKGVVHKHTTFLERPFTHKRQLTRSERKLLPLPITSCCKGVGLTDVPVGAWRDKIREPMGGFDGYLNSKFVTPVLKPRLSNLSSSYSLVEGSWGTNRSVLTSMATPPNVKDMPSAYELLDYSLDRLHKFGLPEVDFITEKWMLDAVTMNQDANPGLYSRMFLGTDKKRAYSKATVVVKRLWDQIVTSELPMCDNSLGTIGGRARKQDLTKGSVPESRIIMMPETPNSMLSSVLSQPLTKALKKTMLQSPECECFMGHDITMGGGRRIRDFCIEGTPVLELDWDNCDASMIENAIVAAFTILRSCYPVSRKLDKLFLYTLSGFVYKNVAIKQRFIYRLTRGVPSGSPFTSLVTTLANGICLNYTLRKHKLFGIEGPNDYKLAVAGDDTLIAFLNKDKHKLESADYLSKTFEESVNLKCPPEDFNYNYGGGGDPILGIDDAEYAPSLLKCTIWKGLPGRKLKDLIKSISCPESRIRNWMDILSVLEGYTSIPNVTPLGREFLITISAFVASKIHHIMKLAADSTLYDVFSPDTYLPRFECIVKIEDTCDTMMRDPPYLRKDKWKGEKPGYLDTKLGNLVDLAYFGIP